MRIPFLLNRRMGCSIYSLVGDLWIQFFLWRLPDFIFNSFLFLFFVVVVIYLFVCLFLFCGISMREWYLYYHSSENGTTNYRMSASVRTCMECPVQFLNKAPLTRWQLIMFALNAQIELWDGSIPRLFLLSFLLIDFYKIRAVFGEVHATFLPNKLHMKK